MTFGKILFAQSVHNIHQKDNNQDIEPWTCRRSYIDDGVEVVDDGVDDGVDDDVVVCFLDAFCQIYAG